MSCCKYLHGKSFADILLQAGFIEPGVMDIMESADKPIVLEGGYMVLRFKLKRRHSIMFPGKGAESFCRWCTKKPVELSTG